MWSILEERLMGSRKRNNSVREGEHPFRADSSSGGAYAKSPFERIVWLMGLAIVLFGLYVAAAMLSYLGNWKNDCAIIMCAADSIEPFSNTIGNVCGHSGAVLSDILCGRTLGVFGLLVPGILVVLGLYLISMMRSRLYHTVLAMSLIAVVGSVTLGVLTDTKWDVFCSGLGGAWGIEMAGLMNVHLGVVGSWIVVCMGWILTGVFINVRFVDKLEEASVSTVEHGNSIFSRLWNWMIHPSRKTAGVEQVVTERVLRDGGDSEEMISEEEHPAALTDVMPSQPVNGNETEDPVGSGTSITVETHVPGEVGSIQRHSYDPDHTPHYKLPSIDFLVNYQSDSDVSDDEINENKRKIEDTLGNFGIPISKMRATIGPTVTLYEIVQEAGVKISKIQGLENDIAQSLKALGIRIIAPMPGRGTIGIEVPNKNRAVVSMRSAIMSEKFQKFQGELPIVIGRNIENENFVFDLAKLPHLLVAGATGMGKSVGLNAIITSLLYRKDPSQLKFVLIDPKMVEFSIYSKLERHFLAKMESEDKAIVTDPKKAVNTLHALCIEMENRLVKCSNANVRNIKDYNDLVRRHEVDDTSVMPYIVVIIDEFADLILQAKEVEGPVMRLAQKARAVGIHLIVATQRPDVKVITGGIKANFPSRIAFRVIQMVDSRTIIDQPGANQLIGKGDMLFSASGELSRIQCALVDTPEVGDIVEYISKQPSPLGCAYPLPDYEDGGTGGVPSDLSDGLGSAPTQLDSKLGVIARDAVQSGQISTSYIQRNYEVGFNRAGRIMTQLEKCGIVGPQKGVKPREILYYDLPSLEAKLQELGVE